MSERQTVLLVGGTSYVASGVIKALAEGNYRVLVVTRRPQLAPILLGAWLDQVEAVSVEEAVERVSGTRGTIVNFAYVNSGPKHKLYPSTRRLIESIDRLAAATGSRRIIHASTIAVFGYTFAEPPRPVPVAWRPGDGYTDLKIYAEHTLARVAVRSNYELAIVRLGNVIGPGATAWTATIAQHMLEGRPVGRVDRLGFSNTTYVDNVGTYLRHLIDAPVSSLTTFGTYHHLAEFSSYSWKQIFDRMATAIGDYRLTESSPAGAQQGSWLPRPRQIIKRVYDAPVGNRLRAALASHGDLPWLDALVGRLREHVELELPPVSAIEQVRYDVVGNPHEFRSHTLGGWQPQVSFDQALDHICAWAVTANYSLHEG